MAKINIKPPPRNATVKELEVYLCELARTLQFALTHIDESNMSKKEESDGHE